MENFNLRTLFVEELGWDHGGSDTEVTIGNQSFSLKAVAHKRGMLTYQYTADSEDNFPNYPTRQKIERAVAKTVREHIIVYASHDKNTQHWQWVNRELGRPDRHRSHIYRSDQTGEALIQKLEQLAFTLDEEPDLTIVDVSSHVRAAFNVEKVTKRFYDRFKKEHSKFLDSIEGLEDPADREWYASLMLNRLMFIYFIQKCGFLDSNPDYLRKRLEYTQRERGTEAGQFQTFYRSFLLRLFHEGMSQPAVARTLELGKLLGRVPYLNGGLFDVHVLEQKNQDIHIQDEAFWRIFDFFDTYQWHLDDRHHHDDKEINPDVLGYIFEKYINQKQMGAYYTKEDITGYIGRNSIIPFLFDQAKQENPIAFKTSTGIWSLLQDDPDCYFYTAVRHGITYDIHKMQDLKEKRILPPDIAAGLEFAAERDGWDKAPPDFALPTENWREYIARRQRYEEVRAKLVAGEVSSINDLINYNLDIEKFTHDVIAGSDGPELILTFWTAINKVSVLDPTCGSGAFLFAALNILEPIYVACLEAMRGFLHDQERFGKYRPETIDDFHAVLDSVAAHPNERYFIFKSIIVNNLYGVDIMEEAVEICKLRLFLKLVAQLESYEQIEPLPDIDFNIRVGNTLVGFTSLEEVKRALGSDIFKQLTLPDIEDRAELADLAFHKFRKMQTEHRMDAEVFASAKLELRERLDSLRTELNRYFADEYSTQTDDIETFEQWCNNHQPFHWFVEFYSIMQDGGFDVIIGNPPYVSASKTRETYAVMNLVCDSCPNIYAWVLERSQSLLRMHGRTGMIVPLSLGFSSAFEPCRRLLFSGYSNNWFSSFGRIPSALFNFDVRVRNTIHLALKSKRPGIAQTTRLYRWYGVARSTLFQTLEYVPFHPVLWKHRIPKLNNAALASAFEQLFLTQKDTLKTIIATCPTQHELHFKQTAYNWLNYCREIPPCYNEKNELIPNTEYGTLYFEDSESCQLAMLLGNGKLMLTFWFAIGDDFHVTRWNFVDFPADFKHLPREKVLELLKIFPNLEAEMIQSTQYKLNAGRKVGNYNLAKCREITDLSDKIFCEALEFGDVWEEIQCYYAQVVRTNFQLDDEDD